MSRAVLDALAERLRETLGAGELPDGTTAPSPSAATIRIRRTHGSDSTVRGVDTGRTAASIQVTGDHVTVMLAPGQGARIQADGQMKPGAAFASDPVQAVVRDQAHGFFADLIGEKKVARR